MLDASVFILFGFLIAALIRAFLSAESIVKYMGSNTIGAVFRAALFGVPLPLCSCGVIPTAVALRKQGASKPATLSFLITTPESSIDSIALTYALIDPIMTIFRPIAAFITGFVSGILEIVFGKDEFKSEPEKKLCAHCEKEHSAAHAHTLSERLSSGFHFAFVELLRDISRWFLIGMVIAGAITYLIPPSIVENSLGSGITSMLIMLVVGLPLYVCATASTPIAAALILKGMSPGTALVFLLVGPATNAASFSVIVKMLGIRSSIIYVVSIAVCALCLGFVLNEVYAFFGIHIQTTIGHTHDMIPVWIKWATAIPLTLILFIAAIRGKSSALTI